MQNDNYVVIQGWMLNELGLSGNELMVYALIYGFSQDGTWFTGSSKYIAEWMGTDRKATVRNVLSRLIEKELIEKREKFVNNVKYCDYRTTLHKSVPVGLSESHPGTLSVPHNIEHNIDSCVLTNVNTPSNAEKFDEIWKSYPRKQGKRSAFKAYERALRDGVTHAVIKDGCERFAMWCSDAGVEKKYIPHGGTWFNQRRWEDDLPDPTTYSSSDPMFACDLPSEGGDAGWLHKVSLPQ